MKKQINTLISILFISVLSSNVFADTITEPIRTFSGHTSNVYSVAITHDSRYALSGSGDGTLKLWDVNSGAEIRTFSGHLSDVFSVAFSPNGRYALSGSWDKTLKLWEVNSGAEIRTFAGHKWGISSVAFSPNDGRYALSGSGDGMLKLWNVNSGAEIRTFVGHTSVVYSVAFSHDGHYALSGSRDGTLKLWDVNSGGNIRTFSGHTDFIFSVAFSPDSRYALSGSGDRTLKLWDMNSGENIRTFAGHTSSVFSVAFSPDGRYALSGSLDETFKLWDVNTGGEIRTFAGHSTNSVSSVVFSPDGLYALSGNGDKTLKLWDTSIVVHPTAVFSVSPTEGDASTVTLDASSSTDSGGTIVDYAWTASNGQQAVGKNSQMTFDDAGTYNITLTVTDNDGLTDTAQDDVIVSEPIVTPPPTTEEPDTESEVAYLEFIGLKDFYQVGETVVMELVETANRDKYTRVDLWMAVQLPSEAFLFRTDQPMNPWSLQQQAYKTSIENTESSHHIFDFELPEGMGGDYTFYAVYVKEGENPVTNGFAIRSNLVMRQVFFADRKD